ncbi:MAG: carboxypeptidase-like regulatory domain-containing protein, partial [bacterium]
MRVKALAFVALVVTATTARGQGLRGTVRDSTGGQPIPGAVIVLLDSAGATLGRNITDEHGQFRL